MFAVSSTELLIASAHCEFQTAIVSRTERRHVHRVRLTDVSMLHNCVRVRLSVSVDVPDLVYEAQVRVMC